jgi:hypothetical protein
MQHRASEYQRFFNNDTFGKEQVCDRHSVPFRARAVMLEATQAELVEVKMELLQSQLAV